MVTNLSQRIWKTRKIRIQTEQRLLRNALIADCVIPFYSLSFIIISIFPNNNNNKIANSISIIGSLWILIASIIISMQQYRLRAYKMKNHYIKLDRLYRRASKEGLEEQEEDKISKYYENELQLVENHSRGDYLIVYNGLSKDKESGFGEMKCFDKIECWGRRILRNLLIFIIFAIPILLIIFLVIL